MNRRLVKQFLFFSLSLLIGATVCVAAGQQPLVTKVLAKGLTVQVPAGLSMTRQRPTEDFELVVFKSGTNTILKVYLGSQPDFPKEKTAAPIQKNKINHFQAESVTQKKPDGTASREVLFHVRDDGIWPQRVHCWYANLNSSLAAEAEQIIAGIQLKDNRSGEKGN
jgi:hypothetical protein